jgi:hypothetical protein
MMSGNDVLQDEMLNAAFPFADKKTLDYETAHGGWNRAAEFVRRREAAAVAAALEGAAHKVDHAFVTSDPDKDEQDAMDVGYACGQIVRQQIPADGAQALRERDTLMQERGRKCAYADAILAVEKEREKSVSEAEHLGYERGTLDTAEILEALNQTCLIVCGKFLPKPTDGRDGGDFRDYGEWVEVIKSSFDATKSEARKEGYVKGQMDGLKGREDARKEGVLAGEAAALEREAAWHDGRAAHQDTIRDLIHGNPDTRHYAYVEAAEQREESQRIRSKISSESQSALDQAIEAATAKERAEIKRLKIELGETRLLLDAADSTAHRAYQAGAEAMREAFSEFARSGLCWQLSPEEAKQIRSLPLPTSGETE